MPSIDAIRTTLTPVFRAHDVNRAVLFGSAAKGTATNKSDLDLLVDSDLRGLRSSALSRTSGQPPVCRWMCSPRRTSSRARS